MIHKNKDFVIADYLDRLGQKGKDGKYQCPNCGEQKLSINKDGKKYYCYGCDDSKAIAYQLTQNNGRLNNNHSNNGNSYNTSKSSAKRIKKDKLIKDIAEIFPDLRYNEHDCKPWLGDRPFEKEVTNPELLHMWLAEHHKIDCGKELAIDALLHNAIKKPFNPLEEDLEGFRLDFIKKHGGVQNALENAEKLISSLSTKYLNTNIPLYDIYLKNWLLSAVGRVYYAGCYARSVVILQGKQNIGKTTFFSILGGEWFSSSLGDAKNKDELMIAHGNWILEWGELETIWGKKSIGRVKDFISKQEDSLRLPYARSVSELKRRFVICGTTNEDQFLTDKTGNTRFWVIPVEKINLKEWKRDRDEILGALALIIHYNKSIDEEVIEIGELWSLNGEILEASEENTRQFEEVHPFEEVIDELIESWTIAGTDANWILADKIWESLDIPFKERPKYSNQINSIMKSKGFKNSVRKVEGKSKRVWIRK